MKEVSHKQELIRWIMQSCASCPHLRSQGRTIGCSRAIGKCPRRKVRKWRKELEKLEVANEPDS
jgi:hypothetical protein